MKAQLRNVHFYLMLLSDAFLFATALILAYLFRFEFAVEEPFFSKLRALLIMAIPLKLFTFFLFGLYTGMWRYTSTRDFWRLLQATATSTLLIMGFILIFSRFEGYSRAVLLMDGGLTFLLTGGLRMVIRTLYRKLDRNGHIIFVPPSQRRQRILIIGAGATGEKILREIIENDNLSYQVVGFIDDDRRKQGRSIHGVAVLGPLNHLAKIIEDKAVKEVLIATPSATGNEMRRIVEACEACRIPYKTLPGMGELIDGRVTVKALRDVNYEDLLGRSTVKLDMEEIKGYLKDKSILVTGCGGSIGAELCRQIVRFQPRHLLLIDASEVNLFYIELALRNELHFDRCRAILGRIQDEKLLNELFQQYHPEVVFHAAAYKHVPMLEKNPWEAVFNNILGSRSLMEIACKHGAERFVLVSTDKAVRPTNVMGATKRVTELYLQAFHGLGRTRFMAVRFGNVVGSSGSVIPVFLKQIEQGGPVTVTDPEVTRYFMTIPEAAQLILQAGAMGQGGEIFVLKMGTPVKIAHMARDLIRLSGRDPEEIPIIFTGLRQGEKLFEEWMTDDEGVVPTTHDKIVVLRANDQKGPLCLPEEKIALLDAQVEGLYALAGRFDVVAIKRKLQQIVPEYAPQPPLL